MKEIFKTLKKYSFSIILVIVLLVIQAFCDLALPDYTSKIVNIGIQQGGIEDAVSEAIRKSEMDKILLFADPSILDYYTLIEKGNQNYTKKYPISSEEDIYVLNEISNEQREQLNNQMSLPSMVIFYIESGNVDITTMGLPEGVDFFTAYRMMSKEQQDQITTTIYEKVGDMEPSLITQAATVFVKGEYKALGRNTDNIQIGYIATKGFQMLGLALLGMVIAIISTYLSSRIAAFFSRDLRSKVVNKVMTYSNKEYEDFSTASLITRSTNDIQQVQMFIVMLLRIVFFAPIMGFGALAKVSGSAMSWIIALAVLVIISIVIILFVVALPKFQIVQKMIDKVNLVAREILTGLPVIRAFGNEKHEEERFDKANKDLTKVNLFVNRVMTIMMPTMMFIMNGICILIVWVGASKIDAGTIQVGTLMAFITYTMQIIMSFLMISMVSIMVPRAVVSMKRIGEIFKKETSIKDPIIPKTFDESKKGIVEFKDVYFRYPDAEEDVLQNISFKALPGTTTAFIGSTGSGKSTLINLIPRFFDVTGGKILIDGVNIKDVPLKNLRKKIGFVPQKGTLFSGTIRSNIEFGTESLTEEQLNKAARISQALEFIDDKEEKFESEISQGGTNVSGGQRQRLAIARAIAINPEIYIFDDSFSALDYKTDAKLRKALAKETKNSTIFIVAQRISTVMHADQIVVLDKGNVVGIGTHKELLQNCQIYKEIALSQLSKEELDNE